VLILGEFIELEDIRVMLRRDKTRDPLPGSASQALQTNLIKIAIKQWEKCAEDYFSRVVDSVGDMLEKLLEKNFQKYQTSGLYNAVRYILSTCR
jgi:hypothetical protein